MSEELTIHDNTVYGYAVNCANRRIVLHTRFGNGRKTELVDVVFHDVLAHRFEHVLEQNILFDTDEIDLAELVQREASLLRESWKWGWPPVKYEGDLATLVSELRARSLKAFEISASLGMTGWVIARRRELVSHAVAPAEYEVPPAAGNVG